MSILDELRKLDIEIRASQERTWVEQLYKEFESICYQHSIKLATPVIELFDSTTCWGQWNSAYRTLQISRELIRKHHWGTVLGILKHEMAHQICSEILGRSSNHDDDFARACRMISVPPHFTHRSVDISSPMIHWKQEQTQSEEDKVLRKVEKLLALAQSANENESYAAMEKVHHLFRHYNLDRIERKQTREYVTLIVNHHKCRIEKTQSMICSILAGHYFVRIIYSDLFDANELKTHKTIEILGTRENVLMAEYVYHFLLARIEALWRLYQKDNPVTGKLKSSYQIGLMTGFRKKLERLGRQEQSTTKVANVQSLIKIDDARLEEYVQQQFPRLTSRTTARARVDSSSYSDGCRDGEGIVIHKGLENRNAGKIIFLPSGRG